mmetsp:Transcript_88959/g.252220  ORF Transcript_88959/g.252220 Transcript_88959/m.252220 type:complete len:178 (+) Transcript_88959:93-626(+)
MTPNRSASLKRLAVMLFDGAESAPPLDLGEAPADAEGKSLISLPWALREYGDCSLSTASTAVSSPMWSRQTSGAEPADAEAGDGMPAPPAAPCWLRSTYEREGDEVIAISRSGVAHKIITPSPSSDGSDGSGEDAAADDGPEVLGLSMHDLSSSIHCGFAQAHKDLAKMLALTRVDA